MPRPRTPLSKAVLTGAVKKNPARYAGRNEPERLLSIGGPSDWLDDGQRAVWDEFRAALPWLTESDRALVEIATIIRARLISGEAVGVQALQLLRQCLGQMGATPSDRSKVAVPANDAEPDPADEFL